MIGKSTISELAAKVTKLYEEMLTNSVRFEELRKTSVETLTDFKRVIERQEDKIEKLQKNHVAVEANLQSRITVLEGRLNSLSESALHASIERATKEVLRESLSTESESSKMLEG